MEYDQARSLAQQWCDAWNRGDLEAILAHYADDVALNSPLVAQRWGVADGWLRGKDALRRNFAMGLAGTPGMRFDLVEVLLGQNAYCVLYKRETGKLVCDLVEPNAEGLACRVVACHGEGPQASPKS